MDAAFKIPPDMDRHGGKMNCVLHPAANGHLALDLNDLSQDHWQQVVHYLEGELGAERHGRTALGLRDRTHQSFRFPDFTLTAGWDSWVGNYLLAGCSGGDEFLKKLFLRLRFGAEESRLQVAAALASGHAREEEARPPEIDLRGGAL